MTTTLTPWAPALVESVRRAPDAWIDAHVMCNIDFTWRTAYQQAFDHMALRPEWERRWDAVNEYANQIADDLPDANALAGAVWQLLRAALLALSIWPNQEHLLWTKPEQVYLQCLMGQHAATLLYGACLTGLILNPNE